ncbi:hypothetical protein ACN47E_002960 [Coniothyrium glycines]
MRFPSCPAALQPLLLVTALISPPIAATPHRRNDETATEASTRQLDAAVDAPSYTPGICHIRIQEVLNRNNAELDLTVFDGCNAELFRSHVQPAFYRRTVRVESKLTPLRYDIDVHVGEAGNAGSSPGELIHNVTLGGLVKVSFRDVDRSLLPHCVVGEWVKFSLLDVRPYRDSGCYWAC